MSTVGSIRKQTKACATGRPNRAAVQLPNGADFFYGRFGHYRLCELLEGQH